MIYIYFIIGLVFGGYFPVLKITQPIYIVVKRLIPMECKFEKFDGESNTLR